MKKRFLSILLSVMMVLSIVASSGITFAAEYNDEGKISLANATITVPNDNGNGGSNAIDGNTGTMWHSVENTNPPAELTEDNEIIITLNESVQVDKLRYLPRQDAAEHGKILGYEIYYSNTADQEDFQLVASGAWDDDKEWKEATFEAVTAQRIKLVAKTTSASIYQAANKFITVVYEEPSVSNNGSASANNLFDGNRGTYATLGGDSTEVVVDLGREVDVENIKLFVAEDQSANLLKKGAIKLSADGENWTTVREFNIVDQSVTDSDDTYDVHEAPYFYIDEDVSAAVYYGDINGKGNVDVDDGTALQKYLVGVVELSEAQLAVADTNHDDKITVSDATQVQLIVAGKSEAEASGTEGGYIEYTINKEVGLNPFTFTVIQNSETISNAKVEVKVYGTDEYVELGTLDKSICDFTLDPQTQVVRISWDAGEEFFIHEMFY